MKFNVQVRKNTDQQNPKKQTIKKERRSFKLNSVTLCTNIIKLCLTKWIVIFLLFCFCTHCRVHLFFVNVNTCVVNRVGYCRKKENVLLEKEWPLC